MDRKHRATGKKPPGGPRPGAGRPPGATSPLGHGEVKAVKALGLRVPADAPESHRELADEALQTIADVMRGHVHFSEAGNRLKAATHVRTEICGPVAAKVEHMGPGGEPLQVVVHTVSDKGES